MQLVGMCKKYPGLGGGEGRGGGLEHPHKAKECN